MEAISLGCHQKKTQRLNAHLVFVDETGFLLIPNVRRTWAPRGQTPILRHRYQRDKISAISAVTVSAQRQRLGLYLHLHDDNITHVEVALFLRYLLRHLRGQVIVVWDSGSIHKGPDVRVLLGSYSRLHVEHFPGYAPELNPDEFVWTHYKRELSNGRPTDSNDLLKDLVRITRKVSRRPDLLRSFVTASALPPFLRS